MRRVLIGGLIMLIMLIGLFACRDQEETPPSDDPAVTTPDSGQVDEPPVSDDPEDQPSDPDDPPSTDEPPADDGDPQPDAPESNLDNSYQPASYAPGEPVPLPDLELLALAATSPIEAGVPFDYTVKEGDYLAQIARCFGTSMMEIYDANYRALFNANYIPSGTVLRIPNPGNQAEIIGEPCVIQHTVAEGDSWEGLAAQYDVTSGELQALNPSGLVAGANLVVPSTSPQPSVDSFPTPANLEFVADGTLMRLNGANGLFSHYPTDAFNIEQAVYDDAANFALVVMRTSDDARHVGLVDFNQNTIRALEQIDEERMSLLQEGMLLAQDGSQGAYVLAEESSIRLTTFDTSEPTQALHVAGIGTFNPNVLNLILSQGADSTHFLLSDLAGLFEIDYGLNRMDALVAYEQTDEPAGSRFARPFAWSPDRQQLLYATYFFEGAQYTIFDRATMSNEYVPEAGFYVFVPSVTWLSDGTLRVLYPPISEGGVGPDLVIFDPVSADGALTFDELSRTTLQFGESDENVIPYAIQAPYRVEGSDAAIFALGANDTIYPDAAPDGGIVVEDLDRALEFHWSPDGQMVVLTIYGEQGPASGVDILLVGLDGRRLSLSDIFGSELTSFHWVR